MKRLVVSLLVVFLFLLVGGVGNSFSEFYTQVGHKDDSSVVAVRDGQSRVDSKYGNEGIKSQIIGDAGVDIESSSFPHGVLLKSAPSQDGGAQNTASVYFLFKADRSARYFKIIVEYHGSGWVSYVDASLSTKEEPRPWSVPINGKDDSEGKRIIPVSESISRFISDEGNIEIHVTASGDALDLGSVSVEYIYSDTTSTTSKVEIAHHHYGVFPPGYSYSIYHYYHKGPIWVYVDNSTYEVYDGWWYASSYIEWVRVYYPIYSTYRYYYHYCGEEYHEEKYIYVNHHNDDFVNRGRDCSVGKLEQRNRSVVAVKTKAKNPEIAPVGLSNVSQNILQGQRPNAIGYKPTRDTTEKVSPTANLAPAKGGSSTERKIDLSFLSLPTKTKRQVEPISPKGGGDFVDNRQVGYKAPSVGKKKSGFFTQLWNDKGDSSASKETRDNPNTGKRSKPGFFDRAAQVFDSVANTVFDTGSGGSGGSSQSQAYLAPSSGGSSGSTSPVVEMKKRPDPPPPVIQQSSSDEDDKDKKSSSNSGSSGGKRRR